MPGLGYPWELQDPAEASKEWMEMPPKCSQGGSHSCSDGTTFCGLQGWPGRAGIAVGGQGGKEGEQAGWSQAAAIVREVEFICMRGERLELGDQI